MQSTTFYTKYKIVIEGFSRDSKVYDTNYDYEMFAKHTSHSHFKVKNKNRSRWVGHAHANSIPFPHPTKEFKVGKEVFTSENL